MNDVLHVSIQENGFYTSIPPLMRLIIAIVSGFICDRIITRKYLSVTNARKTFVFIGKCWAFRIVLFSFSHSRISTASIIPGIFIVAASYAGCNIGLVVIFFAISVGMEGPISSGTAVNPLDLSPNYVGPLTAVANLITSTAGMFAPYLIGVLTPNVSSNPINQSLLTFSIDSLSLSVSANRMATRLLDTILHVHCGYSDFLGLGFGPSAIVEFTTSTGF